MENFHHRPFKGGFGVGRVPTSLYYSLSDFSLSAISIFPTHYDQPYLNEAPSWYKYSLESGLVCLYLYLIYRWITRSFTVKQTVGSEFSGLRKAHGILLWLLSILFLGMTAFMFVNDAFPTAFSDPPVKICLLAYSVHLFLLHSLRMIYPRARPTLYHAAVLLNLLLLPPIFHFYSYPFFFVDHPPLSSYSPFLWFYFFITIVGNFIPLFTPRVWYPLFPEDNYQPSAEQVCSMFNFACSYGYLNPLVLTAKRRVVEVDDTPVIPDYDKNKAWTYRFERMKTPSLFITIHKIFWRQILGMGVSSFMVSVCQFLSPIALNRLLKHLESPSSSSVNPLVWIVLLLTGPFLTSLFTQFYLFMSTRYLARSYTTLVQQIYNKVIRSRFVQNKSGDSKVGRSNNLISTDVDDIGEIREFIHIIVRAPVEIAGSIYLLQKLLGWSAYVGLALTVLTCSVPIVLGPLVAKLTLRANRATDSRIELMSELLQSIRITKFFGWELPMLDRVKQRRQVELNRTWKLLLMEICIQVLVESLPVFSMFATFVVFTTIMGQTITPSIAFTSISLFSFIRTQFSWIAYLMRQIVQIFVSIGRVSDFLNDPDEVDPVNTIEDTSQEIGFFNASLTWVSNPSPGDFCLRDLNIVFPRNKLSIVIGPTGSGKSSLISALLGELSLNKGSYNLPRSKGVSYVSQVPWLRNATIRDNILFDYPYIEERYKKVIQACGLLTDLQSFVASDLTEIGEKGVTLSGGQKQRIALARAVYSPTSIVLMDDVFSALDIHTSNWIYKHCFQSSLMENRTVILVTHNVHLFMDSAAFIVTVKNGSAFPVTDKSSPLLFLAEQAASASEAAAPDLAAIPIPNETDDAEAADEKDGKLVEEEQRVTGDVVFSEIFSYMKHFGSGFYVAAVLLFFVTTQATSILIDLWVAFWTNSSVNSPDVNNNKFLFVYGTMLLAYSLLDFLRTVSYDRGAWWASRKLHDSMLESVFGTFASWFDKTPTGRIVNRFAKDIRSIDMNLSGWLFFSINCFLSVAGGILSVSSAMPIFMIPAVIVCLAGYYFGLLYTRAQVGVKRLISIYTSPIFSLLGESIVGVSVIRAFNRQTIFKQMFSERLDNLVRLQSTSYNLNRWVAVRTDGISGLVGAIAGLIALLQKDLSPGVVGFSLNQAVIFSSSVLLFVRSCNSLQAEMNSYERVLEYSKLPQEPAPTIAGQVPATWPKEGDIVFNHVSVSYSAAGPTILKDVNLHINPGEKVAVVGRTGSGKSTLGLTLLRFTHRISGEIYINGRETQSVNLNALRQRISFIPQDPILFSGTVRSNLDPFDELEDNFLNEALKTSGASSMIMAHTDDQKPIHITLDTHVASEGSNFSQGQKQVLALARAIVRRSKIIILDECTASVDDAMDQKIQKTLREAFGDATMLCIAHRLKTIVDYDKVMVLDKGVLVEYGPPAVLYHNNGHFRRMCDGSGITFLPPETRGSKSA